MPTEGYEGLVDDLAAVVRALDDQLVLASRLPFKTRHKTLLGLRYRVAEIEKTGVRIGQSAIEAASPLVDSVDDSLGRINVRLDHHAEAREELRDLGGH